MVGSPVRSCTHLRVVLNIIKGSVQDFLVADIDGELHRISIDGDSFGTDEAQGCVVEDSKPGSNATVKTRSYLTKIEGVTTTRVIRSDILMFSGASRLSYQHRLPRKKSKPNRPDIPS